MIGVRGSGESGTTGHGIGTTLGELYTAMRTAHPELAFAVYGLPYAARTVSADTVADASDRLAATIQQRLQRCPTEHIIVAGFSLGAEIVGDTMQRVPTPAQTTQVAAAVLLAAPGSTPRQYL